MTRFYDFTLDALSGVQFVVYRDQLSTNGDIESGILAGLDRPRRHDPECCIGSKPDGRSGPESAGTHLKGIGKPSVRRSMVSDRRGRAWPLRTASSRDLCIGNASDT